MKILITGIHGFVGGNFVAAFRDKYTIYGLDIVFPSKEGVERTFSWDELDTIPEVDVVIHLAGKAHDTKNKSEAKSYFDINTGLTVRIYDWFLKSGASKFIYFSSVKAVADIVVGDILTEDVIPNPVGPYGESKVAAEKYLLKNDSVTPNSGKKTYILRPCMIHGSGNKGNLNLLYQFVSKSIPYPLGAFNNKRSFTSIGNLTFIIDRLMLSEKIESGIFNIADDDTVSTNELISIISMALNKRERIWNINKDIIAFMADIGTRFHLILNRDRLKKLTENYIVSNNKIKDAIDIDKLPVNARDGLLKTILSFKKK